MGKVFIGAKGYKLYLGASKIKKAYLGNKRVYSAGNVVTYKVDTNLSYQEEVDSDTSCLSPTTFTPQKKDWTFVGWRENATADGNVLTSKIMGDDPITLYAVFKRNVTINVYYTTTPTIVSKTRYYNNGNYQNPKCNFTQNLKAGWSATGWVKDNTLADAKATYANNVDFYIPVSVWSMNLYSLYQQTITLTVVANSATSAYGKTRCYSTANTYANPKFTVANPSRSGATFMGWSNNGTATIWQKSITNLKLTANTTIYSVFNYAEKTIFKIDDNAINKGEGTYRWYFGGAANGASNVTPNADLTHFRDIDCTNYSSLIVRVCALDVNLSLSGATQNNIDLYIGVVNTISNEASNNGWLRWICHKTCGTQVGTDGGGAAYNEFADFTLNVSALTGKQSLYCIASSDTQFGSGYFNVYLSKIVLASNNVIG